MGTNNFDVPKTKADNPPAMCRWEKSTVNEKGKEIKLVASRVSPHRQKINFKCHAVYYLEGRTFCGRSKWGIKKYKIEEHKLTLNL